jgi:sensor histidine kinase YesM
MKHLQQILRRLFESRMTIHVVFIVFFLVMFCLPAAILGLPAAKIPRVFLYGIFLELCMYSGRWCCRKWLQSSEFQKFVAWSGVAVILLCATGIPGLLLLTTNSITAIIITVLFVVLSFFSLGVFLSITRSTILRQLHEAQIMQEQKESELQLLKSQLSPHFLFNVLNNLYGLSLKQADKVTPMLLKLSGLLRYSLYDSNKTFVPLEDELICIENYIDLEKMRIGDRLLLDVHISKQNVNGTVIPPMLLMTFIENAFKHSKDTSHKNVIINIRFQLVDGLIELAIKNNMSDEVKIVAKADYSGIGLSVTKKRLDLLYGFKYSLKAFTEDGYYTTCLKIKTK